MSIPIIPLSQQNRRQPQPQQQPSTRPEPPIPTEFIKKLIDALFDGQEGREFGQMTLEAILSRFAAPAPTLNFCSVDEADPLHPSQILQVLLKATFASLRSLARNDLSDRSAYAPMVALVNQLADRIRAPRYDVTAGDIANYLLLPWPLKIDDRHVSPDLGAGDPSDWPDRVASAFYICFQYLISELVGLVLQSCPLAPNGIDAESAAPDDVVEFYANVSTLLTNFRDEVVILAHRALRDFAQFLEDLFNGSNDQDDPHNRIARRPREFMSLFAGILLRFEQTDSVNQILQSTTANERVDRFLNATRRSGPATITAFATSDPAVNLDAVNVQAARQTGQRSAPSSDSYNQLTQGFDSNSNNGKSESDEAR